MRNRPSFVNIRMRYFHPKPETLLRKRAVSRLKTGRICTGGKGVHLCEWKEGAFARVERGYICAKKGVHLRGWKGGAFAQVERGCAPLRLEEEYPRRPFRAGNLMWRESSPASKQSLRTRQTLEPLTWHWSHWPGRLVNQYRRKVFVQ